MKRPVMKLVFIALLVTMPTAAYSTDRGMKTWCDENEREPSECIGLLIARWRARGPADYLIIGSQLSKAYVTHPDLLLLGLDPDTQVYKDWRNGLAEHTFTIFESSESLEGKLQAAYLNKLRVEMIATAKAQSSDPSYGLESRAILSELQNLVVGHAR